MKQLKLNEAWSLGKIGVAVSASLFLSCSGVAVAQPTEANNWNLLRTAEKQVSASKITWRRTHKQAAQGGVDVEKELARIKEQLKQQGVGAAQIQSAEGGYRQAIQRNTAGWQQTSLLAFTYQGSITRVAITSTNQVDIGASVPALSSVPNRIEFYDGRTAINVERAATILGQPVNKPVREAALGGSLKRKGNEIFPHIGSDNVPWLVGAPLLKNYSPDNSSLSQTPEGTLILEKREQTSIANTPIPFLTRWTFSKQTGRPLLMEQRYDLDKNKNPIQRVHFTAYKRYTDGIWFASRIVDERLSGSIGLVNEQPRITYVYDLVKAEFNEAVDNTDLQRPLPKGTVIVDSRFAPRPSVTYSIERTIPSDAAVLKMVQQREAEESEQQKSSVGANADPLREKGLARLGSIVLGVLIMSVGFMLWFGPPRKR